MTPRNDLPALPKLLHSFFHEWLVEQRKLLTGRSWRIATPGVCFCDSSLSGERSPFRHSPWNI